MSNEQLSELKEQLASLAPHEKLELAKFLAEQVHLDSSSETLETGAADVAQDTARLKREQHLEWLNAHREEYAGRYVALDGDRLVGHGSSIREAHEQARQHGVEHPFLVRVSSVNEAPFGGW